MVTRAEKFEAIRVEGRKAEALHKSVEREFDRGALWVDGVLVCAYERK